MEEKFVEIISEEIYQEYKNKMDKKDDWFNEEELGIIEILTPYLTPYNSVKRKKWKKWDSEK